MMKLSTLAAVGELARRHDRLVAELRKLESADLLLATFEGGGDNVTVQSLKADSKSIFHVMRQVLKSRLEEDLVVIEKGLAELGVEADVKP